MKDNPTRAFATLALFVIVFDVALGSSLTLQPQTTPTQRISINLDSVGHIALTLAALVKCCDRQEMTFLLFKVTPANS
jgi:hypothetical protein